MIDPNDQTMAPIWTSIRILLLAVGTVMATAGLGSSKSYAIVMLAAGSVSAVGSAAWGVYVAITNAARARQAQAKAVQSGINLVTAGQALTNEGELIQVKTPGATPPKPVTEETAKQIVAAFAPAEAPKAL